MTLLAAGKPPPTPLPATEYNQCYFELLIELLPIQCPSLTILPYNYTEFRVGIFMMLLWKRVTTWEKGYLNLGGGVSMVKKSK